MAIKDRGSSLFAELPPDEKENWSSLRVPESFSPHATTPSYGGYLHVPCGYLLCENDRLVPVPVQEVLVKGLENMGGKGITWRFSAGHEPGILRQRD